MRNQEIPHPTVFDVPQATDHHDCSSELIIEVYDYWNNPSAAGPTAWCSWSYKDGEGQVAA